MVVLEPEFENESVGGRQRSQSQSQRATEIPLSEVGFRIIVRRRLDSVEPDFAAKEVHELATLEVSSRCGG